MKAASHRSAGVSWPIQLGVNLDFAISHATSRKKRLADVAHTCHP